ncbi:MAG: class I SAM-dependent rRNA methyltransferase [Victivallaceae bacterium]|nr:class I SAM-dependent rRNA methyltransferase [Victivallaceae bacterium]
MNFDKVILKPGREKSLLRKDLWVYSGAVETPPSAAGNGDTVEIFSHGGNFLARAAWSPSSQIRLRVWSFDQTEDVDSTDFFRRRVRTALELRRTAGILDATDGYRLIAAEGDALPGAVVDIYGDFAVVQLASAGADLRRSELTAALREELPNLRGIYERSDLAVRGKEGLPERTGTIWGEVPPSPVIFREHKLMFAADPLHGHKTGFYFDQRENRRLAGNYASSRRVLNLFSYTGGFGVACAAGGAEHVENVDSSAPALELAAANMELNHIPAERYTNTCDNVFELLRRYEKEGRRFDLIVLDPPKLADSQRNLMKGCRAYKELALRAFKLLEKNGLLFTFSCSGLVDAPLFAKLTSDGALDAGADAAILKRLAQDADHPVRLNHPETEYLKGLLVARV